MNLSGLLAASAAAVTAATVVSISAPAKVTYQDGLARKCHKESSSVRASSGNNFAPRFDDDDPSVTIMAAGEQLGEATKRSTIVEAPS
ncbi:hypothetical protein K1719_027417 [Acacia pycnantha]|nr:hypothetical protein K1719_027417 [Acacia pycnantha]